MKPCFLAGLALACACRAGVMGASVDAAFDFPSMGAVYVDGGVKTIDGTVEYPVGAFAGYNPDISVQITDSQLILADAFGTGFGSATFNGLDVHFLTGSITGAVADGSSAVNPVISIVGNDLFLNYQGESLGATQSSIIDLTGTGASVPEPATVTLLGAGLAAIALMRRRVRR